MVLMISWLNYIPDWVGAILYCIAVVVLTCACILGYYWALSLFDRRRARKEAALYSWEVENLASKARSEALLKAIRNEVLSVNEARQMFKQESYFSPGESVLITHKHSFKLEGRRDRMRLWFKCSGCGELCVTNTYSIYDVLRRRNSEPLEELKKGYWN